jgi:DNA-binding transcriptional ArsR family regulator
MSFLTQQQIAEHLGLSQPSVSGWLAKLGLTVDAGLDTIRLAYVEALRAAGAARTGTEERDTYFRARRQLAELRVARERGEPFQAAAVRQRAFRCARTGRDGAMAIQYRLGPLLAAETDPAKRAEMWDRELRQLCEELARNAGECP